MNLLALCLMLGPQGDLLLVEEAKPVSSNVALNDKYGTSVGLDGNRLVVGSIENQLVPDTGRIYVWERSGTVWTETAQLVPAGLPAGQDFGCRVAVDGDTVVGLAQNTKLQQQLPPMVQLTFFENDGQNWNETGTFHPPVALTAASSLAASLDLSDDVAAVGFNRFEDAQGVQTGAVVVYERAGTSWNNATETVLFASNGADQDMFGRDVALGTDILVVGAPGVDPDPYFFNAGALYVFERQAGLWIETAILERSHGDPSDFFGCSVAIENDRIAAGVVGFGFFSVGAVSIWQRTGSVWAEAAQVQSNLPMAFEMFGSAVALGSGRLAVGSPYSGNGGNRGAAWLLTEHQGTWTVQKKIVPSDAIGGMLFGSEVDVSGDRVAAGAPGDDQPAGNKSGSAYVLRFDAQAPVLYCTAKPTGAGCVPAIDTAGQLTLSGSDDFTVTARQVPPGKTGIFFYGTNGPAAVPFLGGTLCVLPPLVRTLPQAASGTGTCGGGYSFSLSQAILASALVCPGDTINGQWWMRDPQNPDGTGAALSDAFGAVVGS